MFLHLGKNESVRLRDTVGIFDLETTTLGRDTKNFLHSMQDGKKVVNLSGKLPKSFVLADNELYSQVFISDLPPGSLKKRITHERINLIDER